MKRNLGDEVYYLEANWFKNAIDGTFEVIPRKGIISESIWNDRNYLKDVNNNSEHFRMDGSIFTTIEDVKIYLLKYISEKNNNIDYQIAELKKERFYTSKLHIKN